MNRTLPALACSLALSMPSLALAGPDDPTAAPVIGEASAPAPAPTPAPAPVAASEASSAVEGPQPVGGVIPKSGNGLRAGGITLIVHGGLSAIGFAALLSVASFEEFEGTSLRGVALGGLALSAAEVGGGTAMTVIGVRRKRVRDEYMMRQGFMPQPDGNGMTVMGGVLLGMGAIGLGTTFALSGSFAYEPTAFNYVTDGLYVAGGAVLLGVGLWRRAAYRDWAASNGYQLAWTPYAAPARGGGATFGVSGRF